MLAAEPSDLMAKIGELLEDYEECIFDAEHVKAAILLYLSREPQTKRKKNSPLSAVAVSQTSPARNSVV